MKALMKGSFLAVAALTFAGVGAAATIPIGATQTYGTPFGGTFSSATWVSLSSLGTTLGITITPGTTQLNFTAVGGICFNGGGSPCTTDVAVSGIANPVVGGFTASSGSTSFIATSLPQFNTTASGDWSNDLSNDFAVTSAGASVVVPTGASFVVFVFRDSYYQDNVDNSPVDFGVDVTSQASAVPEPATYTMVLIGLGAVAAARLKRRKR